VLGDSLIQHLLEGEVVLEYTRPRIGGGGLRNYDPTVKVDGTPLSEGHIALQAESHPTHFRKVEVLSLIGCMDPRARNYKAYYVKAANDACIYR
jgi:hypothetical protein